MLTHRHGLQSTFIGDESVLYSIGGHDGWSFLMSVERFDFNSKAWTYVSSMVNIFLKFKIPLTLSFLLYLIE